MLRQAAVEWAWIGVLNYALWWVLARHGEAATVGLPGLLAAAVLIVLVAGRLHALGVVLHDACHMARAPGSRRARTDPALGVLALLAGHPIGTTIEAMRFHHLRHHRFSCQPADPYFKRDTDQLSRALALRATGLLIAPFWTVRALLGTAIVWLPGGIRWLPVYRRVFLQDRSQDHPDAPTAAAHGTSEGLGHAAPEALGHGDREALACARADPAQLAFLAVALLSTWRWPSALALGYWLPLAVAGLLNAHRVIAEHRHVLRADDGIASLLATTVTHGGGGWKGRLRRLFLYPRNIGYHEVHHLYPSVALAALPALDAWWRGQGPGAATGPVAVPGRQRGEREPEAAAVEPAAPDPRL